MQNPGSKKEILTLCPCRFIILHAFLLQHSWGSHSSPDASKSGNVCWSFTGEDKEESKSPLLSPCFLFCVLSVWVAISSWNIRGNSLKVKQYSIAGENAPIFCAWENIFSCSLFPDLQRIIICTLGTLVQIFYEIQVSTQLFSFQNTFFCHLWNAKL